MNDLRMVVLVVSGVAAVAAGAWWLWPVTPVDTPYFQWQPVADNRYELVVNHVGGNPEFRSGLLTPQVPRTGTLRVAGTADPGSIVEVSNPRTGRGYAATTDAAGAFTVDAEARRGDTLRVISRVIEFRPPDALRYSSTAESSP